MTSASGRIAASILVVLLASAYFVASRSGGGALPLGFVINAAVLTAAFWFPTRWIRRPADLARFWKPLLVWIVGWTLAWDLATAGIGDRAPFQEWWIVYPAALAFFAALLLFHALILRRFAGDPVDDAPPAPR